MGFGIVLMYVCDLLAGGLYEIDMLNFVFGIMGFGDYCVDVVLNGVSMMVMVCSGSVMVYGSNG